MADGRITGASRALKAKQAREYANIIVNEAQYLNTRVQQDGWEDAGRYIDYLIAYAMNLRETISELKRG